MDAKICSRCRESKPTSEFYFNKTQNRRTTWCRDCFTSASVASRNILLARARDILGGRCQGCGITDQRVLCFDHKDGRKGKRESGDLIIRMVIGGSDEFQLLCHNCNHLKRLERREFAPRDLRERVKEVR